MDNFLSLLFYLGLTGVLLILCKGKGDGPRRKRNINIAYIVLFVVAAVRFGIGNDYVGYAPGCNSIARWFQSGHSLIQGLKYWADEEEEAHIIICWLFHYMRHPFVWLYFAYSFIQVGLLYLILSKENEHFWGIFLFIIGEFMFCSWDAIRQFTAVLFVIYGFTFVKGNEIIRYLICIGLASFFHHSAIFVLPVYLLRWVKINRWILLVFLGLITVISVAGIIQNYQQMIAAFFDIEFGDYSYTYGSWIETKEDTATSLIYRIRLLMVGVFYWLLLYFYPKDKNHFYEILLTIGTSVWIFATNSLIIMRVSWYFWAIAIVIIGPSFRNMTLMKKKLLVAFLAAMFVAIFSHDVLKGSNTRGCQNYTTIFTNDLDHLNIKRSY